MNNDRACALCNLDVGTKPFVLHGADRDYQFCCEGCRGIYQMLHDIKDTPVHTNQTEDQKH